MKVLLIMLISMLLFGCGSLSEEFPATSTIEKTPTQTTTPTSTPSLTPEPNSAAAKAASLFATQTAQKSIFPASLTESANSTSTAVSQATMMLDEIKLASKDIEGFDFSSARLVFGPKGGILRHTLDNKVITYNPGMNWRNFVVSIKFLNPYDTSTTGKWDYGILFRNEYGNNQYRLSILSNQSWTLYNAESETYIYTSNNKNLTAKGGEENTIWLIVIDTNAYLFINGVYTRILDVSAEPSAGDISPATGLYYGNLTEERITEYKEFTVWSLP